MESIAKLKNAPKGASLHFYNISRYALFDINKKCSEGALAP